MRCVSGAPFHMYSTNNAFCQGLQCRGSNHPTASALEETDRSDKQSGITSGHSSRFQQNPGAIAEFSLARKVQRRRRDFNLGCITIVHKREPPFFSGFYIRYPDVIAVDKCNPVWISWTKLGIHPDIWTAGLYQDGS